MKPADCVVLEDCLAGVRAANAAGIPVIGVPEFSHDEFQGLTPHIVESLLAARDLLPL